MNFFGVFFGIYIVKKIKTPLNKGVMSISAESAEIRTHGSFHYTAFPRLHLKPLGRLFQALI